MKERRRVRNEREEDGRRVRKREDEGEEDESGR
jgi:hypothetical protein